MKRRDNIVYRKRSFNEKFDPHLSEIGHVCESLLDARFLKKLHKLFLGCLRKMEWICTGYQSSYEIFVKGDNAIAHIW